MTDVRSRIGDVFGIVVLGVIGVGVALAIYVGVTFHSHFNPTPPQKVLNSLGVGSYLRNLSSSTQEAYTPQGQAVPVYVQGKTLTILIVPSQQKAEDKIILAIGGARTLKWVGKVEGYLANGGASTEFTATTKDAQWTMFFNQKIGLDEIQVNFQ